MNVLMFGGSGFLGRELRKIDPEIICPTHNQCDISNRMEVIACVADIKPDIVINAAAVLDNRTIVTNPSLAVAVNITGAANVALAAIAHAARQSCGVDSAV